jgi:hypothetical protein
MTLGSTARRQSELQTQDAPQTARLLHGRSLVTLWLASSQTGKNSSGLAERPAYVAFLIKNLFR